MNCNYAQLYITDGTTRVDLLDENSGFHLYDWTPAAPEPKEGGVWSSSPVADGRRLAMRYYDNAIDTFVLQVRSWNQDALVRDSQELRRLLEKAVAYFASSWTSEPVWICAQGRGEENPRYAVVCDYRTPRDGNPYSEPFWSMLPAFEDFQLIIEHRFWQADEPGSATCVELEGKGESVLVQRFYPAQSTDDCYVDQTGGVITLAAANLYFGNVGGSVLDSGIRFRNVTIPGNVTIIGARLVFTAFPAVVNTCTVTIDGERSLAPAAFSTVLDFNGRVRTAASVAWTVDATPNGTVFVSPSITTVVQEINNQIGWASGTDVVIFISDNGSGAGANRAPFSWDNLVPAGYPTLEIYYSTTEYGRDATCTSEVYVSNKHNRAQLTDIYSYDASTGVYSANLFGAVTPFSFLPAVPANGDIVYFGVDNTIVDGGPFNSLVFDIGTAQAQCTIAWEYYSSVAAAFSALGTRDNTAVAQPFDTTGVNLTNWKAPTDWVTTTVNGVTGYWVRARVTAVGGAPTPPAQQNREIYTVIWPYVTLESTEVGGDIAALARHILYPESENYIAADTGITRAIIGLRSTSRGSDFTPYLNVSNEQNAPGVTCVVAGANTSFVTDMAAPSGIALQWAPPAAATMGDRATITIDSSIASQWKGAFHAFVRVGQFNAASADYSVRLVANFGGSVQTTQTVYITWVVVPPVGIFDGLVDLGTVITLDAGSVADRWGDCTITVQAATIDNTGTSYLYVYDVILMPVDECTIDARYNDSVLPYPTLTELTYLDIDSATVPKVDVRAVDRYASDNRMVGNWTPIVPGNVVLQANSKQRLWFLSADITLGSQVYSSPYNTFAVQSYQVSRYLSMRGAR